MNIAVRFGNFLIVSHGFPEIRMEGLKEFRSYLDYATQVGSVRLLAFSDGSTLIDEVDFDGDRVLSYYENNVELLGHLFESSTQDMCSLRQKLFTDSGLEDALDLDDDEASSCISG